MPPDPIVIVEIDGNSRLRILQTSGVRVGYVDCRGGDNSVVVLPATDSETEIMKLIDRLRLISPKSDDEIGTAANRVKQLRARKIVVAGMADE